MGLMIDPCEHCGSRACAQASKGKCRHTNRPRLAVSAGVDQIPPELVEQSADPVSEDVAPPLFVRTPAKKAARR